jgi:hypothetical protein
MLTLSCENLAKYDDGALAVLIDQALRAVYLDLDDRPLLNKTRSVTVKFDFKPRADVDGAQATLKEVQTDVSVSSNLPNKATRTNHLFPDRAAGGVGFEPDTTRARYHPDQLTMPDPDVD